MSNKNSFQRIEAGFENLVGIALRIYGHPFTFGLAVILVIIFLAKGIDNYSNVREFIRDLILSVSFLSFFIIQRAVNKTTTSIHIKMNELIAAQDKASNDLIKIEDKTETELEELKEKHDPTISA